MVDDIFQSFFPYIVPVRGCHKRCFCGRLGHRCSSSHTVFCTRKAEVPSRWALPAGGLLHVGSTGTSQPLHLRAGPCVLFRDEGHRLLLQDPTSGLEEVRTTGSSPSSGSSSGSCVSAHPFHPHFTRVAALGGPCSPTGSTSVGSRNSCAGPSQLRTLCKVKPL